MNYERLLTRGLVNVGVMLISGPIRVGGLLTTGLVRQSQIHIFEPTSQADISYAVY